MNLYSYNKWRTVEYYDGRKIYDETIKYKREGREHEIQIFEASLSFSVLAWLTLALSLFLYILSFCGIINKVPGLANAKDRDCSCEGNKFVYTYNSEFESRKYYAGPYVGWFVVVIGTFFTIIGAVINIFSKTFNFNNRNSNNRNSNNKMSTFIKVFGFVLTIFSLALYTIGVFSYWRQKEFSSIEDDRKSVEYFSAYKHRYLYINEEGIKKFDDTVYFLYDDASDVNYQFYFFSLLFCCLAWAMSFVSVFTYIMSFIGLIYKSPIHGKRVASLGRYILIPASVFGLLSVLIFSGHTFTINRLYDMEMKFMDYGVEDKIKYYEGPSLSYFACMAGSLFTIIACIINLKSKIFELLNI
ncbi:hypothetical protein DICPUDRAFT_156343 [Dictyostelium purpureum]|uniref:Uncharacterized protein n=1 Tax=Dictyostelium purpureum TaxID=5786 RepID=F0ZWB9_DICPU|nr:uncharacterized protein DICPUDRAFT_156343 [Dictyostelium purpureum]EGC31764.1 hypothetical protein DICPUDRAFT_156343 [Dictyostelium purpureum]|eukprot:XP_003291715.1 hypothetical protein DICPUDRAFT_156343 [Dictyostelium purpureum]